MGGCHFGSPVSIVATRQSGEGLGEARACLSNGLGVNGWRTGEQSKGGRETMLGGRLPSRNDNKGWKRWSGDKSREVEVVR